MWSSLNELLAWNSIQCPRGLVSWKIECNVAHKNDLMQEFDWIWADWIERCVWFGFGQLKPNQFRDRYIHVIVIMEHLCFWHDISKMCNVQEAEEICEIWRKYNRFGIVAVHTVAHEKPLQNFMQIWSFRHHCDHYESTRCNWFRIQCRSRLECHANTKTLQNLMEIWSCGNRCQTIAREKNKFAKLDVNMIVRASL